MPTSAKRSSIDMSVESHIMAYAAEEARITGTVVDLDQLKERLHRAFWHNRLITLQGVSI